MATAWDNFISPFLTNGEVDFAKLLAGGFSAYQAYQVLQQAANPPKFGYQGTIPKKFMAREFTGPAKLAGVGDRTGQVRPGSGSRNFFTAPEYTDAAGLPAAKAASEAQKTILQNSNNHNAQVQVANQELDKQAALANNNPAGTATALIDPTKIPGVKAGTDGLGGKVTDTTGNDIPVALYPDETGSMKTPVVVMPRSQADTTGFQGVQGSGQVPTPEPMSQYKDLAGNLIPQRIIDAQAAYKQNGAAQEDTARAASDATLADIRSKASAAGLNAIATGPNGTVGSTGKTLNQLIGAAKGGLMGLAKGGAAHAPRYLHGETDGMADQIPATIEGQQPAALAHGEFVIPADVVSHLGNGNSDAGAKQLYKMMDKIRKARTGRKSQGKRIDPDKFTPGGIAGYKTGGSVVGQTMSDSDGVARFSGTSSGASGESSLSNWAGDYVTGLLSDADAASSATTTGPNGEKLLTNFMTYGQAGLGPLTAGDSALQTQAYQNAGNLAIPDALNSAAANAGALAKKYDSLDYKTPAAQAAVVNAASKGYTATDAKETKLGDIPLNTYQANLQNYQMNAPKDVTTDKFYEGQNAQNYMSPYMQQVVENQQRDAQRQADIAATGRHADMVKQGAFGGSRQAIMDAEAARNLAQQKGDIQAQGLQSAYQQAQQQYSTDAARQLQGGVANQNAALGVGTQNLGANLTTQALGTQTGLQAALANQQMQGQYGLAQGQLTNATNLANAGYANQASQFGANASNTAAINNSQLGTQTNLANAASQNQNNQFAANFGLQALAGQNAAIGLQGQMGTAQNQAGLANLNAQLAAGNQQQATTQAGITADIADFNAQRDSPLKALQFKQSFLSGMPLTAQNSAGYQISSSTP